MFCCNTPTATYTPHTPTAIHQPAPPIAIPTPTTPTPTSPTPAIPTPTAPACAVIAAAVGKKATTGAGTGNCEHPNSTLVPLQRAKHPISIRQHISLRHSLQRHPQQLSNVTMQYGTQHLSRLLGQPGYADINYCCRIFSGAFIDVFACMALIH